MEGIQPADPGARRRAILTVACAAVAGAALIGLARMYRPAVEQWITRDPELAGSRLALALTAVALAMTASALGFAAYFWRLGAKAVRAERFPPPGLATVRDTPIVRGPAARRRGRLLQSAAVALAVVAGAIPFLVWRLLSLVPT